MSFRDRNYAASQRAPRSYWLAFALGLLLLDAASVAALVLLAGWTLLQAMLFLALVLGALAILAAALLKKG